MTFMGYPEYCSGLVICLSGFCYWYLLLLLTCVVKFFNNSMFHASVIVSKSLLIVVFARIFNLLYFDQKTRLPVWSIFGFFL